MGGHVAPDVGTQAGAMDLCVANAWHGTASVCTVNEVGILGVRPPIRVDGRPIVTGENPSLWWEEVSRVHGRHSETEIIAP